MRREKAAALAGIMFYLKDKTEREQLLLSQHTPYHRINPWAYYSRNTTSKLRRLIQSRRFGKHSFFTRINTYTQGMGPSLQKAEFLALNQCRTAGFAGINRIRMQKCTVEIQKKKEK